MANKANVALKAARAITDTQHLAIGWAYGRGVPSADLARIMAQLAVALFMAVEIDDIAVFPDVDGGVMVTGYRGDESFEVLATPEGRYEIMFENAGGEEQVEVNRSFDELKAALEVKGWRGMNISASYLQSTTTLRSGATSDLLSRTQARTEVYPSFQWTVLSAPLVMYAGTSHGFTLGGSTAPQLRSGALKSRSYQRQAA